MPGQEPKEWPIDENAPVPGDVNIIDEPEDQLLDAPLTPAADKPAVTEPEPETPSAPAPQGMDEKLWAVMPTEAKNHYLASTRAMETQFKNAMAEMEKGKAELAEQSAKLGEAYKTLEPYKDRILEAQAKGNGDDQPMEFRDLDLEKDPRAMDKYVQEQIRRNMAPMLEEIKGLKDSIGSTAEKKIQEFSEKERLEQAKKTFSEFAAKHPDWQKYETFMIPYLNSGFSIYDSYETARQIERGLEMVRSQERVSGSPERPARMPGTEMKPEKKQATSVEEAFTQAERQHKMNLR